MEELVQAYIQEEETFKKASDRAREEKSRHATKVYREIMELVTLEEEDYQRFHEAKKNTFQQVCAILTQELVEKFGSEEEVKAVCWFYHHHPLNLTRHIIYSTQQYLLLNLDQESCTFPIQSLELCNKILSLFDITGYHDSSLLKETCRHLLYHLEPGYVPKEGSLVFNQYRAATAHYASF